MPFLSSNQQHQSTILWFQNYNAFKARLYTPNLTFKSVTDKQTHTNKYLTFLADTLGGRRRSNPIKLNMVVEDFDHILATLKCFGIFGSHVQFPCYEVLKILGKSDHFKPSELCNPLSESIQIVTAK